MTLINYGDPRAPDRFWSRVSICPTSGCWLWIGKTSAAGYGEISHRNTTKGAHRFAFEHLVGAVPEGLQLDHCCRVRSCVNPSHLEPVTARENLIRGNTFAARNARATSCHRGHPFTKDNTRIRRGRRECRTCCRANAAANKPRPIERLRAAWSKATPQERTTFLSEITNKEES